MHFLEVVAREGEVVGIARVGEAVLAREAREAAVHLHQQCVAQPRAGGGALRAGARSDRGKVLRLPGAHRLARRFGHQDGQYGRDLVAVAERDQEAAHPPEVQRGKELLDVQAQHHALADVRLGVAAHRVLGAEAVRVLARRQLAHQHSMQPPLNRLEP